MIFTTHRTLIKSRGLFVAAGGAEDGRSAAEEWEVVAVETAAHELVDTVAAHAPLASEVLQLNGVHALLRLLDGCNATAVAHGGEEQRYLSHLCKPLYLATNLTAVP